MPLQLVRDEQLEPEATTALRECLKNMDWFSAHSAEISKRYKGKYVAVARGKVSVADSYKAAYDLAIRERGGQCPFVLYVPLMERKMIYTTKLTFGYVRKQRQARPKFSLVTSVF